MLQRALPRRAWTWTLPIFTRHASQAWVNATATKRTDTYQSCSFCSSPVDDRATISKPTTTSSSSSSSSSSSKQAPPPSAPSDSTGHAFNSLGMSLNTPLTGKRSVIDGLGPTTFTIGGVRVKGSVLIMPLFSTMWNVETWDDVCAEAFALVKVTLPKPDMLIVGSGATVLPVPQDVRRMFTEIGVSIEVIDTKNACHTFNVLNQEARNVAAALLPLSYELER